MGGPGTHPHSVEGGMVEFSTEEHEGDSGHACAEEVGKYRKANIGNENLGG